MKLKFEKKESECMLIIRPEVPLGRILSNLCEVGKMKEVRI